MSAGAHAERRSRSLRLAVFTSFLSKGGNVLLMLLAIPVAYRVLGEQRAAIFGVMQSLMWLVSMSDLGTGPGMVRRLAGATASGDRGREASIVSTGFFVSTAMILAAACILAVLLGSVPLTSLFGKAFAAHESELRTAAWASLGIFTLGLTLTSLERVREGYQEVHLNNTLGSLYNITAAAVLWLGVSHWPSPVFVICAVYGLLIPFSSANILAILAKRPWILPRPRHIDRSLLRSMIGEGLALFVAGSLAPILVREAPKFMLGRTDNPEAAADVTHYWILVQLGFLGMGFVMMITRPLWPAMAEAAHRSDFTWVRSARTRLNQWALPASLCAVLGFSLLGPWFTQWWLKAGGAVTREQFTLYGAIFCLTAWSHLHYIVLGSLGLSRAAAWLLGIETVIVLVTTWTGIQLHGLTGGLYGTAAGMAAVSSWAMPLLLHRHLRQHSASAAADATVTA